MIKNYKIDVAGRKQEELQLIRVNGSYKTWRVYFDIHENEELKTEEEREWIEYETRTEWRDGKDKEGNPIKIPHIITEEIHKKETVVSEVWESKYVDFTKHKDETVTATGLMKEMLLNEIDSYDTSSEVNSFFLNEMPIWLNKDTRVGLMNSTNIQKAAGQETTTLWLGTIPLVINCDLAIQLLGALELYALECFNRTAEHKKNVGELETVEKLVNYDYTEGYPEKLNLTI